MSDGLGSSAPVREFARAKINLCLHVTGRRPDGYHLLESLTVFPEIGDVLTAEPGPGLSLAVSGPFAQALGAGADNLVLRAADRLGEGRGASLLLEKRLPLASGMGGGSADAAAALRALARLWGLRADRARMAELALSLGADVPVCLGQRPAVMAGIGERLTPAPALPEFWMVLVNPMVETPTGQVFAGLESRENPPLSPAPDRFGDVDALARWLAAQRNDLEAPAARLRPAIGEVLEALEGRVGGRLARMTGSGATCFALFELEAAAIAAADEIRKRRPPWWVAAARVPAYEPSQEFPT